MWISLPCYYLRLTIPQKGSLIRLESQWLMGTDAGTFNRTKLIRSSLEIRTWDTTNVGRALYPIINPQSGFSLQRLYLSITNLSAEVSTSEQKRNLDTSFIKTPGSVRAWQLNLSRPRTQDWSGHKGARIYCVITKHRSAHPWHTTRWFPVPNITD